MRISLHFRGQAIWGAATLAVLLFVYGPAAEASPLPLSKDEQKCVNTLNQNGAKLAKAQGGDNAACVKNFGKLLHCGVLLDGGC
jgi:hypothetical protein